MIINTLLRIAACLVLLGFAWQHYAWETPYRVLLWDESFFSPMVKYFGISWQDWIGEIRFDEAITKSIKCLSILFLLGAMACFEFKNEHRFFKILKNIVFIKCAFLILLIAVLTCKDQFYRPVQFFEFSMQWTMPFFIIFYNEFKDSKLYILLLKICLALAFIAHGLYALNMFPIPANFINMTITILGCSETFARQFLYGIGWCDIIFSILIFVPKVNKIALIYCIVWGFATALARIWANYCLEPSVFTFSRYTFEFLIRSAHFLVPLWLVLKKKLIL